jgi:hypothetical protein
MASALRWAAIVVFCAPSLAAAQVAGYSVKTEKAAPPKELDGSIRKLLGDSAVKFQNAKGLLIAEVWLRKQVPAEAAPDKVKTGISYREIPETTILGAVRFDKAWSDYRQQKVKAGVYTIRLGFQPQNGDHMGTAPYPEFGVLLSAFDDKGPGTMDVKKMHELSSSSIGTSHPAVFLLYPDARAGPAPHLEARPNNQVILSARENVRAGKAEGVLGIGLTLVGHAD